MKEYQTPKGTPMNTFLKFLLVVFILISITSCQAIINIQTIDGSGNVIEQSRPLSGVQKVTLATQGELTILFGNEEKLVVSAEDNLLPYLTSEIRGGELEIANLSTVNLHPTKPIQYILTVKSLAGVTATSLGNIHVPEVRCPNFTLTVSSSGNIDIAGLFADRLNLTISSSGDITILTGEVSDQTITISSSGNYTALNVTSKRATVTISSSGNANIQVSEKIKAAISSSGNVNYAGKPVLDWSSSSSGKVIPVP